jgi:hypothetical protein
MTSSKHSATIFWESPLQATARNVTEHGNWYRFSLKRASSYCALAFSNTSQTPGRLT